MLGGLKAGKFDAIMAVPEWLWAAEGQGFGKAVYNVLDESAWIRVFGGPLPVVQCFWLLMLAVLFAGKWPEAEKRAALGALDAALDRVRTHDVRAEGGNEKPVLVRDGPRG